MRMLGGHLAIISDLFPTRKTRKFRVRISQNNCGVWTSKESIRKGSVVPLIQKGKCPFPSEAKHGNSPPRVRLFVVGLENSLEEIDLFPSHFQDLTLPY